MILERDSRLVIISGPSGAGKTTVIQKLMEQIDLPLTLSVSATTRPARPDEQDGVHYLFLSDEEFQQRRASGDFLECCEVFGGGQWYGTLATTVTTSLAKGKWVILEIDVEGTRLVLDRYPDAITVFIRPQSLEELERRLRERDTETEDTIQRRLAIARKELDAASYYEHHVINESVDQAVADLSRVLKNQVNH